MYQKQITIILLVICFIFSTSVFSHENHDNAEFKMAAGESYSGKLDKSRRCIIKQRPLDHVKLNRPLKNAGDCTMSRTIIRGEYWPQQTYTIPIVFHIIHKRDGTGNISDQRIRDQVSVLNQDYGAKPGSAGQNGYNTKVQFRLAGITRTANDNWFNDRDERGFKQALGWDQQRYFNVYVNSASGYLGYAYLPQEDAGDVYDGVVVLYEAVGGRNNGFDVYDQGRTLVHEVGHYLGLLHTFEGYGCFEGYESGDLIADTHSENNEHYDCRQTSTCGTPDDIHNYMNYTEDTCMYEFTPDQANRIVCSLVNYRPKLYSISGSGTQPTIKVTSPNGGETLTAGSTYTITWTTTGTVGNVKIEYTKNNGSNWSVVTSSTTNDGAYSWAVPNISSTQCKVRIKEAADGSPVDASDKVFTISKQSTQNPGKISLNRKTLNFSAAGSGRVTGSQKLWLNNTGSGTLNWQISTNPSWLKCTPSSGKDSGVLTVSVNPAGLSTGNYSGTITISASNASNSPQTVSVNLKVINASQDRDPFGSFGTPLEDSTVRSSVPVTGWVLDDVEIKSVKIYRQTWNGSSFIGEAVFVEGARPDLEAAYPNYPKNHMAGWGYMMLTNFLPDGTHRIYAVAADSAGNQVNLGSSTIFIDNAHAEKPFGAIDAPAQGGSASGKTFRNVGWVLTPLPNRIPTNGSTISVYVDGKYLGHPTYNIYRSDIAAYFPGYANSSGAMAYLEFDTTEYNNGVHSIQWVVTDNGGNTDGVGSRYFTVRNSGTRQAAASRSTGANPLITTPITTPVSHIPLERSRPLRIKKGYNPGIEPRSIFPDASGTVTVEIHQMERLEIQLTAGNTFSGCCTGNSIVESQLRPLPAGSTLDSLNGVFYWQPLAGFLGQHELVFVIRENDKLSRINLVVNIVPSY